MRVRVIFDACQWLAYAGHTTNTFFFCVDPYLFFKVYVWILNTSARTVFFFWTMQTSGKLSALLFYSMSDLPLCRVLSPYVWPKFDCLNFFSFSSATGRVKLRGEKCFKMVWTNKFWNMFKKTEQLWLFLCKNGALPLALERGSDQTPLSTKNFLKHVW